MMSKPFRKRVCQFSGIVVRSYQRLNSTKPNIRAGHRSQLAIWATIRQTSQKKQVNLLIKKYAMH